MICCVQSALVLEPFLPACFQTAPALTASHWLNTPDPGDLKQDSVPLV